MTAPAAVPLLLAAVLAVIGLAVGRALLLRGRRSAVAERLRALVSPRTATGLVPAGGARRLEMTWLPRRLRLLLARADVAVTPAAGAAAIGGITAVLVASVLLGGVIAAAVAAAVLPAAAAAVLSRLAARRTEAFLQALPGWLDGVRQLVVVGNSLQQAIERATRDGAPEVRRYLRGTVHQLRHGAPLGEALTALADRYDLVEIHMISSALQANLRYGGRLADVLANLTGVFQDRLRIRREMQALTSETRTSIWVLAALPLVVLGALAVANPNYVKFYFEHDTGHWLAGLALGVQVLGILVMRRLMRVTF